ncbi:MAG: plastocyanin/azurin family copper-binding protein [Methylovulum miyakonense]|uniref:plastocyanin/azurin family copper-binding protein n=1 Tax=Methylovulum miyakonense TaxID=645578 RepID=UPI003BB6C703
MDCIKYTILAIMLSLASVSAYAKTITVNIQFFAFNPTPLTIDLGDTVKWVNKDPVFHTTTEDTSNLWSANLAPSLSFARTFKTAGKFTYHCAFHPGMTGSIIVRTSEETRINIGKNIVTGANAVLPITLKKTTDQVYQGSYIVNTQGSCADCHSCPTYKAGRNPFNGERKQFNSTTYLAGGVAFGPFVSRNLTPNINGKPAGMTLAQFKGTLRTGHSPNNPPGTLLQVMPWPIYGQMSDYDLEAIYAYLQSIPPAKMPTTFCANAGQ